MNCDGLQRLVHAYVDSELDLMSSLDVETHLESCGDCRARHAELRALRKLAARHLRFHGAPGPLKARIARKMRIACRDDTVSRSPMWHAAAMMGFVFTLALLLAWVVLPRVLPPVQHAAAHSTEKMVYHIAAGGNALAALRNVRNHLEISPNAKIIVVAHDRGVDFLLRGAKDGEGNLYELPVSQLATRGVDFRLCQNTLTRRRIDPDLVISEVHLVPSGIAEISRLQTREGYAYMKL